MIKHGSTSWRVLVELAGQDRAMAERELFEALDGRYTPEQVKTAVAHLGYGGITPYIMLSSYGGAGVYGYAITWEGQELLRRMDAQTTAPMPTVRKRWWRRGTA